MTIDLSQFHATYFEESFELLEVMESTLLEIDSGGAAEDAIHTIFRAAHSIKGGAGTFGFTDVSEFTHRCETLLDEIRSEKREMTKPGHQVLLESVDVIRAQLEARQAGEVLPADQVTATQAALDAELGAAPAAAAAPSGDATESADATPTATGGFTLTFAPYPHLFRTGNDPVRIIAEVAELGPTVIQADLSDLPDFDELDPTSCHLSWTLELQFHEAEAKILEAFEWVGDDAKIELSASTASSAPPATSAAAEETASAPAPAAAEPAPVAAAPAPAAPAEPNAAVAPAEAKPSAPAAKPAAGRAAGGSQSIRVSIEKIDDLINMVGELVITQSMLKQIGENFDVGQLELLRDKLVLLDRNTRELQESVMRIRMVPISFAFNRFPRLVHDLSMKLGKKIELKLAGEQTELDKTVMEKISDPLNHLVRNALDHGVEMPQDRVASGKPETGVLNLNAYHAGGNIVIEIQDDGKGLDEEKILARARERGLVAENETPPRHKIHELILAPGFSTAETISDISGRGVGMDVVRKNIASIGGTLHLESTQGKGSTFTIKLPLTLAILDGQTVRVGDENYILPLVSIIESVQLKPDMVSRIAGRSEVFRLRDEYLSIIRLRDLFDIPEPPEESDSGLLVVVENDRQKLGLLVDELMGQQQVVIKSLETNYKRVDGISGATILGDGTVALILDVPGLVRISAKAETRTPELQPA